MRKTITLYLLERNIKTAEEAVKLEGLMGKEFEVNSQKYYLYIKKAIVKPPEWITFFNNHLDVSGIQLFSASSSAVLILRHKQRYYAITFGQGRHLLKPGVFEERFGLMVTLNAVEPSSIRSITRQSFGALARVVQEQSSRLANAAEFGIEIDKDLLRAVTGTALDEGFARSLSGADSLVANINFTIEGVPGFLDQCVRLCRSQGYKEHFSWVDHIAAVKNNELIKSLDLDLMKTIRSNNFDRMWLAQPTMLDWSKVAGFTFMPSKNKRREPDLHFRFFLESVNGRDNLSVEKLKNSKAYCWANDSDNYFLSSHRVYDCINCEITRDDSTFLLNNGKWYCIDRDFVREVNSSIDEIPTITENYFPECIEPNELSYNNRIAQKESQRFFLLDRKNINYGGGPSKIEVCDLVASDRRLVHIKRYGGSSVLSHFFAQASVAGELLVTDLKFRGIVNKLLPRNFQLPVRGSLSGYEIILGIISRSRSRLELPFFSKVNLRSTQRRLTGLGYRVSLATIRDISTVKIPCISP